MLVVILIYDLVLFRPLVAWADRFRFEHEAGAPPPRSWVLNVLRRSGIVALLVRPGAMIWRQSFGWRSFRSAKAAPRPHERLRRTGDRMWSVIVLLVAAAALWQVSRFVMQELAPADIGEAFALGLATLLRIVILIAIASLVWVPVGVWVGTRPRATRVVQPIAQFLAAFPANLLFPLVVSAIVDYGLDPDIWLSPLMILGTQWYILFNVIAGAMSIPYDLREVASLYRFTRWQRWTKLILPGIFPYLLTGLVTASGGAWNASVMAEYSHVKDRTLETIGLGAQIDAATDSGHFAILLLATIMISLIVITMNRLVWRRLYRLADTRFKLG
jgi:NitT/TauT family transport system permease protein